MQVQLQYRCLPCIPTPWEITYLTKGTRGCESCSGTTRSKLLHQPREKNHSDVKEDASSHMAQCSISRLCNNRWRRWSSVFIDGDESSMPVPISIMLSMTRHRRHWNIGGQELATNWSGAHMREAQQRPWQSIQKRPMGGRYNTCEESTVRPQHAHTTIGLTAAKRTSDALHRLRS